MGIKYKVNEQFFDIWSDDMAYVLGYMYADGHVIDAPKMRGQYICFTSTDRDRIDCFRKLMGAEHKILERNRGKRHKISYQLRIGSKYMFKKLLGHGVTPHKSSTVLLPDVPSVYLAPFVRGYFDGDGCAFLERSKVGGTKKLLTVFTCGSKPFLEELHLRLILEAGIQGTRVYEHGSTKGTYQLRYSTRNSLRLFNFMYNSMINQELCMRRKYVIFIQYLEEHGLTPVDIPDILVTKGPVAKEKRG